jgi:hypothetical protein
VEKYEQQITLDNDLKSELSKSKEDLVLAESQRIGSENKLKFKL